MTVPMTGRHRTDDGGRGLPARRSLGRRLGPRPRQLWARNSGARAGFTIIELLVSAAITVALAGILIGIVSTMTTTAQRASGALLSSNQAKVALDFLAQDLQSVVMRRDGNVWLAATVQPDQTTAAGDCGASMAAWTTGSEKPVIGTPGTAGSSLQLAPSSERLEDYRFGMAGVWLRMFCVEPDSNDSTSDTSAVRASGYQIVRYTVTSTSGSSLRYGFFRSWVRPFHESSTTAQRSTFFVGYSVFSGPYNDPDATIPGSSPAQTAGSGAGEPGGIRQPDRTLLLGNNVIDFGVRFWARESSGTLRLLYPSNGAGVPSATNCGFAASTNTAAVPPNPASWQPVAGAFMTYGFPDATDIFLRVLTDEGAKQIENLERGLLGARPADYATDGEWWWAVALANSTVYTRRVEMKGRPM
jgi:hypothetical protein